MTNVLSQPEELKEAISFLYKEAPMVSGTLNSLTIKFKNAKGVDKEIVARLVNRKVTFAASGSPETFTILLSEGEYLAGKLEMNFNYESSAGEPESLIWNYGYSVVTVVDDPKSVIHYSGNEAPIESEQDLGNFVTEFHEVIKGTTFESKA